MLGVAILCPCSSVLVLSCVTVLTFVLLVTPRVVIFVRFLVLVSSFFLPCVLYSRVVPCVVLVPAAGFKGSSPYVQKI